ncbi:Integrin beta-1 [Holothuria leucospilota]|uniref:Integrin beta n=1 Tax=Holothuria leucospilota TaxID=206669 RepID=A0A9Q0YQH4_HOLLE|nr:Integrin beta-1 [Holothuria leucospilota]
MSRLCAPFLTTIFFLCGTATAQRDIADESCTSAISCSDCIRRKPSCSWCESSTFTDARCDNPDNLIVNGCEKIFNPETALILLKNDDLADALYENEDDLEPTVNAIQVKPQRVKLRIRQGDTQRIQVRVRQASDYPVDLYYLMDLSHSMSDDLKNLKLLGNELPSTMRSLTRRFRLGFGSFVDKPVLPYIKETPGDSNAGPCDECEKTYSFRNVLPLSNNAALFQERLLKTNISGNLDVAEGTLDAVMQVAVCQDHIGWRNNSRKLLVVTTDAPFHVQGDGRLAGIIKPNDGRCHLDSNHEYHLSHIYDYPSIGHLDRRMSENNIISIFAVTNRNYRLYNRVSQMIRGSTAAVLYGDSRNILEIINTKYNEISSNIEMIHNAPANLQLSFTANCSDGSSTQGENKCRNFHVRDEVSFDIDITAVSCPVTGQSQSFNVHPIGYDEKLTVEVEVICNCSCDLNQEANSSSCGGHGTLVCGECFCDEGRFGQFCECSSDTADKVDSSRCRPNNITETLCAGRGDCFCGRCNCHHSELKDEIYSGTYCECNNKACPMFSGEVCGGSDKGECVCGKDGRTSLCECRPGFSGKNCGCPTQTETCIAGNGFLCNLLGECECGRCRCNSTRFFGPRCDDCASCTECDLHKNCIRCEIFEGDHFEDGFTREKCDLCTEIIWTVTKLPPVNGSFQECTLQDNNKCSIPFLIGRFENEVSIYVKDEPVSNGNTLDAARGLSCKDGRKDHGML